jgi:hypothetical protein
MNESLPIDARYALRLFFDALLNKVLAVEVLLSAFEMTGRLIAGGSVRHALLFEYRLLDVFVFDKSGAVTASLFGLPAFVRLVADVCRSGAAGESAQMVIVCVVRAVDAFDPANVAIDELSELMRRFPQPGIVTELRKSSPEKVMPVCRNAFRSAEPAAQGFVAAGGVPDLLSLLERGDGSAELLSAPWRSGGLCRDETRMRICALGLVASVVFAGLCPAGADRFWERRWAVSPDSDSVLFPAH